MTDLGKFILITMFYSRMIGILEWSILLLMLAEVIICKDARQINTERILNTPKEVRLRIFRKSWKSPFYKATFIIFFSAMFSMVTMILDLWLHNMPRAPYTWTLISLILPLGLIFLYSYLGYQITFFKKFTLFIHDQHE